MQSDQNKKEEAGSVKAKLVEQAGGEADMDEGVIVTVDHIPTNAGQFASGLRKYGSDEAEMVTHNGREAGHPGLPLPCRLLGRFVHFLRGRG